MMIDRLYDRRTYLVVFALMLHFFPLRMHAEERAMVSQKKVDIWQGVVGKKKVEMIPYLAKGNHNIAVIVCPGGSYFWHDMDAEGKQVGEWLQSNGISAFVLHYRTAGFWAYFTHFRYVFRGNRYPDAQEDLLQAILYIKERAQEYGIDANRVGAMGFSAGGHLVMSAGEHLLPVSTLQYSTKGKNSIDASLAFIAPIYPVVSMMEPCTHKRSRRALLGDGRKNNRQLRDSLSLERHVPDDCPPVFLVNCKDDPIVKYHNSELLDSALSAHHVPHRYIQYQTGGHGFGASKDKGSQECRQWKGAFLDWLKNLFR